MRIITGKARGMNLFSPKNYDVRPTADRVKESVFNILGSRVVGAKVLDVFAGTGNLGLEAWSRGAAFVTFIDKNRESLKLVERNVEKCKAVADCHILQGDSAGIVAKLYGTGQKFDLVFADPPYNKGLLNILLDTFVKFDILTDNALIIAEHSAGELLTDMPGYFTIKREEKYGLTKIAFIQKANFIG